MKITHMKDSLISKDNLLEKVKHNLFRYSKIAPRGL